MVKETVLGALGVTTAPQPHGPGVPLSPCPLQLLQGAEPVGATDGVRPVQRTLQPLPGAGVCVEGLQLGRHEGGPGAGEEALATTPGPHGGKRVPTQAAMIVAALSELGASAHSGTRACAHARAHSCAQLRTLTYTHTHTPMWTLSQISS